MTSEPISFGFLDEPLSVTWRYGTINPLPNFEDIVTCFKESAGVYKGWIYPPIKAVDRLGAAEKMAWIPATFSVPSSHILTLNTDADPAYSNFLIALFGFLNGRRLQREGWQHFYKAPISRQLCDFFPSRKSIDWALNQALTFCEQHNENPEVLKLAFGALHWHTFAQLYEHEFERFDAQYKALDACHRLTILTQKSNGFKESKHAMRAHEMCKHYEVEPPDWVLPVQNLQNRNSSQLADRRNALAHEALYGGEPLGFAHPADFGAMDLGLRSLVSRLLLSVLGIRNEYTKSSSTTRALISFEAPPAELKIKS